MTTSAATHHAPTWYETIIGDLFNLLKSQPQQVLLSVGSVTIVAAEAALMVPTPANVAVAIGAEWAYLRGIASSGKGDKGWVYALNWGALALVVLYGMLWGGRKFGAIAEHLDPSFAWGLVAIHIIPLAFVSLAAAMVHRSSVAAEEVEAKIRTNKAAEREERLQAQRDAMLLEAERKEQDLALWIKAQEAKAVLKRTPANSADTPLLTALGTPTNTLREHQREQVARTLREQPDANKTELAKSLNIGRTLLYQLIKEAKEMGEL
jgi:hypothetical protein